MKKFFTLITFLCLTMVAMAQPSAMKFEGPSRFGVAIMDAWQDNETDTIVFTMTSSTEADITMPAMTYNAMGLTIPSFTIHGVKFEYDMTIHDAVFAEQTYAETITVDGVEKTITGKKFTATYSRSAGNRFTLSTTFKYGNMPLDVTYSIDAVYVTPTAIEGIVTDGKSVAIYDLMGRQVCTPQTGRIYIVNGKKRKF